MQNIDIIDDNNTENMLQEIMNNVSKVIKHEIDNYKQKIYLKNKENRDETNKAILSLPLVQQIIYSYEEQLSHKAPLQLNSTISVELNEHKANVDMELAEIKGKIDKIEQMLQEILSSKQEENIILKIEETVSLEETITNEEVMNNHLNTDISEDESEEEVEESEEEEEVEEQVQNQEELELQEEEQQEVEKEIKQKQEQDSDLETEQTEDEEEEEEEEEEELIEIEIDDVTYFVTDEENGVIYDVDKNGEPGKKVGKIVDGEPIFE